MKVKKLLTLVLAAALMVGCNSNTNSGSGDNGQSSVAPSSDNSSGGGASDDSSGGQQQTATLTSISVSGPTNKNYFLGDEDLDLEGLVVTASYSDGTTRNLSASEYQIDENVDFRKEGDYPVTVTFEDKTASFTVNVAKPVDWSNGLKTIMGQILHGYVAPFFFGPDYNLGYLSWRYSTDRAFVVATGDANIAEPEEGQDSPLKPIVDLLIANGFKVTVEPDPTAAKPTYRYELRKELDAGYAVDAELSLLGADGKTFASAGKFYIALSDPYYYSWEETGYEAEIQSICHSEVDIPNLPNGRYSRAIEGFKIEGNSYDSVAQCFGYESCVPVHVTDLPDSFDYSQFLSSIAASDDWSLASASFATDMDAVGLSSDGKMRILVGYQAAKAAVPAQGTEGEDGYVPAQPAEPAEMMVVFFRYKAAPTMVDYVSEDLGLPAFAFEKESSSEYSYYLQAPAAVVQAAESLDDIRDWLAADLVATGDDGAKYRFEQIDADGYPGIYSKGTYAFVKGEVDVQVTIYAVYSPAYGYYLEMMVEPYFGADDETKAICNFLGINPLALSTDENGDSTYMKRISDPDNAYTTPGSLVTIYAAPLFNDFMAYYNEQEYVLALEPWSNGPVALSETVSYMTFSSDTKTVSIYAQLSVDDNDTPEDTSDDVATKIVVIYFDIYNPQPQSAWVDSLRTGLAEYGITFRWDNTNVLFFAGGAVTLGEGETTASTVNDLKELVLAIDDSMRVLAESSDSFYDEMKLYCATGYVDIQVWDDNYGEKDEKDYKFQITITLFKNPSYDKFVNAISAAADVELKQDAENSLKYTGVYSSSALADGEYSLEVLGANLATRVGPGAGLAAANGLGFAVDQEKSTGFDAEKHQYVLVLTADDGEVVWEVTIVLTGDEFDTFDGNYNITVIGTEKADAVE